MKTWLVSLTVIVLLLQQSWLVLSWGSSGSDNKDKVLLEKVTAITLTEGQMTKGRRSSAVKQLDCVGGSAGCYDHRPRVVQCKNVGFDGYDVQWECTADLDRSVRFGQIEVSCEGYDYPEDPYILRGSCGLRYELDQTSDGHRPRRNDYYDDGYHGNSYSNKSSGGGSWVGSIIQLVVVGVIIWVVLGACFGAGRRHHSSSSNTYSSGTSSSSGTTGTGSNGPGFWTGAATGGMLGYMFGNRNGRGYYGGHSGYGHHHGGGWGSGWSSGHNTSGWGSGGGGWSSSRSSSSSSRSSSGFGGTSRR